MEHQDPKATVMAVAALTVASFVGMGTAMLYSRKQVQAAEQENDKRMRQQRRKYRERYRQTAEY